MAGTTTKPKLKAVKNPITEGAATALETELERRGVPKAVTRETANLVKQAAAELPRWALVVFAILGAIGAPALYAFFSTAQAVWGLPSRVEGSERAISELLQGQKRILEILEAREIR